MSTGKNVRDCSRGFTLVELIVVMAILAIAAAIIVPYATGTTDLEVISAARVAASDLQYAQNVAIVSQSPVTVTFAPAENRYSLSNASGPLIDPMTKESYVVDFDTRSGFRQLRMVSASFSGSNSVTFDEMGVPDNAGTVRLQAGSHVCEVGVASATGKVTVTIIGS